MLFFKPSLVALLIYFNWRLITLQYCGGFCHTSSWITHGCTCVPHPEPPSHLPPYPIPLGCPRALALGALLHALNLRWSSILHMVIYMFQCYSLISCHPCPLPHSPKACSVSLFLSCINTGALCLLINGPQDTSINAKFPVCNLLLEVSKLRKISLVTR